MKILISLFTFTILVFANANTTHLKGSLLASGEYDNNGNFIDDGKLVDILDDKSRSKYPESTKHIEDTIKNGQPDILTINRDGASSNRKESLKGMDKVPGSDLDEYPPAMFKEGGQGVSVRPINRPDNRGSGSTIGHELRPYPDGTKVKIIIID